MTRLNELAKAIATLILATILVIGSAAGFTTAMEVYAAQQIHVTVDDLRVSFPDQQPTIIDSRTLVPVRGVFEKLGFDVDWDDVTRTVIIERPDFTVLVPVGSRIFTTNGRQYTMDVPAQLINERTMLPIRAIVESVGYYVDWDDATNTVLITTNRNNNIVGTTDPVQPPMTSEPVIRVIRNNDGVLESPVYLERYEFSKSYLTRGIKIN